MSGWYRMHRDRIDAWRWSDDPDMFALFTRMLVSANYARTEWKGEELLPGQLVFSRKAWALKTGISEQTIRTCLDRLKSVGEITIKSTNKFSVVTLHNWGFYQGNDINSTNESTKQSTGNQPATNRQLTGHQPALYNKEEEGKERKKEKDISSDISQKKAEAFLLPEWMPKEAWLGFEEMRAKKKKPLTDYARSLIVKRLVALRDEGHDPEAVLNQSTQNSWQGIFGIERDKARKGGGRKKTLAQHDEECDAAISEFFRAMERGSHETGLAKDLGHIFDDKRLLSNRG